MSSLGDLFHALPTVHSLKAALGSAVDWVVNPEYAEVVGCFNDVDDVIVYPRRGFFSGYRDFRRRLRERDYEMVVDLQGLLKSALVAQTARARRRIGPSFCREAAHLFYRELAGEIDKDRHAVEECMDVLDYLSIEPVEEPAPVSFPAPDCELPARFIAIAPVSRWPTKDWPIEHFIEAGSALHKHSRLEICIVGGPGEVDVCREIATGIGDGAFSTAGRTNIPELGGLLERASLLISVDSGPVHIASAVGTPVLGLYGITDPHRTGPYARRNRVIRAPGFDGAHGDYRRKTPGNLAVMRACSNDLTTDL